MGQHHVLKLGLAILVFAIRPTYALQNEPKNKTQDPEHYLVFYQGVEGTPGIDFPIYSHIPKTSFSCKGIESGYYADLDTDCQVFHICEEEKKISFLCPNGTIFQQSELICEWWFKVNCTDAPGLYAESAEHLRNDIARRKLERKVKRPFGAVMRTEEVSTVSAKKNGKDIEVKKLKTRRYNDDQTGNFINRVSPNGHSRPGVTIKEYHVQFGSTSSGFDKYETNGPTTLPVYELEASTRRYYTQQSLNLNKVKTIESTTQSEYELQFPNHKSHNQKSSSFNQIKNVEPTTPASEYELEFPTHKSYSYKDSNLDEIKTTESSTTPEYELEFPKYSNKKAESDELIREESASFVKNPLNSIQDNSKNNNNNNNNNPYPNHRTTYSDLKTTPKFNLIRTSTTISSVTPQYITTQPINNGKPFLGSRVGTNLFTSIGTVPVQSTSTTTSRYTYLPNEESKKTAKVLIKQTWGSTTPKPLTTTLPVEILFTSQSSKLPLDHATIYGSHVPTTPAPRKKNKPENDKVKIAASSNQGVPIKFDKNTDKIELTLSTRALSNKLEVPLQKNSIKISIANTKSKHSVNGKSEEKTTVLPTFSSFNGSSYLPTTEQTTSGFFVTKPAPRPFKTVSPNAIVTPTYTNYKISSASPFKATKTVNPIPTQPTPFTITLTSPYENVDNMINVLKKIMDKPEYSQTPRPGLVVPPSVGPQTLHTLAVYFANALDGTKGDKQNDEEREIKKEKLMNILTQMTLNSYNNLFDKNNENDAATTTETPEDENNNNLETQSSHNFAQSPEIRELARNFSIALSSYLHDPEMFKKDLEELRPTEPPASEENQNQEDELLNFSDADIKSSLPPVFSTISSNPGPTWGFVLAPKLSEDVLKNSINPDLNTADSQSFVPGFNDLNYKNQKDQKRKVPEVITTTELPENHWTSSFNVTSLWNSAFSVNPVSVNDHFETTPIFESETDTTSTEEYVQLSPPVAPEAEVNYELRTLPKLTLNSTQIHGILIDFMNKTSPDAEKLHRILKRLNTTEGEFLTKMKEIEMNPLTKRLILLLISECGINATKDIQAESSEESLTVSETAYQKSNSYIPELINPELKEDDQDARALQLLNTLYHIASRFG